MDTDEAITVDVSDIMNDDSIDDSTEYPRSIGNGNDCPAPELALYVMELTEDK